jgi:hypothetical protein
MEIACENCHGFIQKDEMVKYNKTKGLLNTLPEFFCGRACFEKKYITKCNTCERFCSFEISIQERGNTKYYCNLDCYKRKYNSIQENREIQRTNEETIDLAKNLYLYQKRSNSVNPNRENRENRSISGIGKTAMVTNLLDQLEYPCGNENFTLDKITIV